MHRISVTVRVGSLFKYNKFGYLRRHIYYGNIFHICFIVFEVFDNTLISIFSGFILKDIGKTKGRFNP